MQRLCTLLAALLLPAIPAFAATLAVLPGTPIQAKVDLAQPGDIVAIFGGTYPGDVTVNKAIRLVEADGEEVTITGNVTFTGITNPPPFEGFTVGSSGKGITISNTTGIVLKNIDARAGFGVAVNGTSKAGITGGFYSQIAQDGGELSVFRTEVTGSFTASVNSLKTVAFRVNVAGDFGWSSRKAWCGYSNSTHFNFNGNNAMVVVVKCVFDAHGSFPQGNGFPDNNPYYESYGVSVRGSGNSISILNNEIYQVPYAYRTSDRQNPYANTNARGIWVEGDSVSIVANNYVEVFLSSNSDALPSFAYGIIASSSKTKIYANIIEGPINAINAPFGADVRNNCTNGLNGVADVGGQVHVDRLNAAPLFVVGERPKLQPTSPCVNRGVNDPIFNDLDGSRNDIGPFGGCFFDPQGRTTDKPVVISFDLAPQQLLKGVDTQVTLSNGQAVSQP